VESKGISTRRDGKHLSVRSYCLDWAIGQRLLGQVRREQRICTNTLYTSYVYPPTIFFITTLRAARRIYLKKPTRKVWIPSQYEKQPGYSLYPPTAPSSMIITHRRGPKMTAATPPMPL